MNRKHYPSPQRSNGRHLILVLLLFGLMATGMVQAANQALAQTKVTAHFKQATLHEVLWEIQKQTGFTFIYNTADVEGVTVGPLDASEQSISNVLDLCLAHSNLEWQEHEGVITIRQRPETHSPAPQQQQQLKGVVIDEQGEPIIGAHVLLKGATTGVLTDNDGRFTIEAAQVSATVVVTYVGYMRQEVKVSANQPARIILKMDSNLTEEVVITGYGTFKKSAYAGSASSVKSERIADVPAVSFQDLLQGNAPGVQFTASSGQPGASSSLNIRGMGSFNASNSPLYVIDGVPVISGSINAMTSDAGLDVMATINSSDIESITIIKDAAAASLYGSRAANGVTTFRPMLPTLPRLTRTR